MIRAPPRIVGQINGHCFDALLSDQVGGFCLELRQLQDGRRVHYREYTAVRYAAEKAAARYFALLSPFRGNCYNLLSPLFKEFSSWMKKNARGH
jgi:hypothetical protein